jgi:hypothetical protein
MTQQSRQRVHPTERTMRSVVVTVLILCAPSHLAWAQAGAELTGTVRYYSNGAGVPDVTVALNGVGGTATATDANGGYGFSDPGPGTVELQPMKMGGTNGAVSALDAAWILQAVVGMRQLTPNQVLACDVTGDGTVSALDAARILQLVAGLRSRLPVAESCGSDWAFVPDPTTVPNQRILDPAMAPMCSPGMIAYDGLATPAAAQDFLAIAFGDCTGNWVNPNAPVSPTAAATASATATATASPTATPTRTATITVTGTRTATPPASATATWTVTRTRTATWSATATATITATPTRTPSLTGTPTRTGTATITPTRTFTVTPTVTPPCPNGLSWDVSPPLLVSAQSGGNLWLAKTVPTDTGWGIFWLRQDPGATNYARLYYAHVDFSGSITVGPMLIINIPQIVFRGRYYLVAWNTDHYGLLISNQATLYYYNLSRDGVLSGRKVIPVTLFLSDIYDQESDGDLDAFPGGFLGVIEGECAGHSCSYAFKLDANGNATSSVINLVDFDLTHQFYPRSAFDGSGFAIISVKDIQITSGGVMTKYLSASNAISSNAKVVPAKQYLWDEFPDLAWNGDHFAAIWTENSARLDTAPWQIHFASFRRTAPASTLIADRVIDVDARKTDQRWTTQVHAAGAEWVAQYATRAADNSVWAVYELLGDDARTHARLQPFPLNADALGSSPHVAAGHVGELGIARGAFVDGGTEVTFRTLPPPACAP